jgi:archaemetzincin
MRIHIFWDRQSPEGLQIPVARNIAAVIGIPGVLEENPVRIAGYVDARKQVDAQVMLDQIAAYKNRHRMTEPVLLVLTQDLFNPGHSFVFGLAREPAGAAVVSMARLSNNFYGRDGSDDDLIDRTTKEGAHEIGHLFGLGHCDDHECIMFCPDTLDELDGKRKLLCRSCSDQLAQRLGER